MRISIKDPSEVISIYKEDRYGPFYNIIILYRNGIKQRIKYDGDYTKRNKDFNELNNSI